MGLDPLPDNFEQDDLKTLSARIGEHLRKAEKDAFALATQTGNATEAK